jgi:hypothetical protein
MATIANLDVNLRAKTQKYETNMKNAGKSTRRFSDTTRDAAKGTESFQAKLTSFAAKGLIVTGVIAGIGLGVNKLVQDFAKLGDSIGKAAARTQISTDDFQTLSFAFEQSGGSAANLETSIRSMSAQYLELQRGTSNSVDLFNRLGLTLSDLQGLDVADQFRLIARSISNVRDPLERAAIANRIFGRSGSTILPLIANLDQYEQRLRDIGGVISGSAIKDAEDLTDLNNELSRSWDKLTSQLSSMFVPAVRLLTESFRELNSTLAGTLTAGDAVIESGFLRQIPVVGDFLQGALEGNRALSGVASGRGRGNGGVSAVDSIIGAIPSVGAPQTTAVIDRQIEAQKELIRALKDQSNRLAPLPQALQKGTSAQIGFVAQLQRQNQQAKIDAREKKKIDLAEKHLKELEKIRKQREDEFKDKTEISIL